jgi:hypothetical protein
MNRRNIIKGIVAGGALGMVPSELFGKTSSNRDVADDAILKNDVKFWLESTLKRVYPTSPAGRSKLPVMLAARNEKISFQACFKNLTTNSVVMKCEMTDVPDGWEVRVRRVGFVPMQYLNTFTPKDEMEGIGFIPGLCPDPLFPETSAHVGPESNGVFWVSCKIPAAASPKVYTMTVRFTFENAYGYVDWVRPTPWTEELPVTVDVRSLVIKRRTNFPTTDWISADSIWEYYKIEPCGERFWELADAFIANIIEHNEDVIYTPLWNIRHELLERPAQLLKVKRVGEDKYEFDFSDVRKWVRIAVKYGANYLEWPHFFTPAPTSAKYPQRIYERTDQKIGQLLWPPELSAISDMYRKFLEQFIPLFKEFLISENVFEKSLFHCADEPDGEAQIADYRKARALLKELAPWMKVMDAMSDTHFATERLSDMPVPSIVTAMTFKAAGCPSWVYWCNGPRDRYLQRLLDTPLAKIRMSGWLFYALDAKGFLHWAYNYWLVFCTGTPDEPFKDPSNSAWPGMPQGDCFVVYPGPDGPIDSIRWEVFSESLQDYALLQSAGIKKDDPMFAQIKDYYNFPKTETWLRDVRQRILSKY